MMNEKRTLTSKEISTLVNHIADEFTTDNREEVEMVAKIPPSRRWLIGLQKAEEIRADLRNKLMKDFPELSMPEINMKVLRSLTPVRMGKNYTEPAYHEYFG